MYTTGPFNKTRIAPTPSGFLHMGNVLSFSVTAMLAKRTGASILLRIDDLDRERIQDEYVQDIFDTLEFLEIPWDEGPRNIIGYKKEYSQVHRLPVYHQVLEELKAGNHIFACDCSRSQLVRERGENAYSGRCRTKQLPLTENLNWRVRTASAGIAMQEIGKGMLNEKLPEPMQDFIVKKKDGYPSYQLASVCDDMYFGIDLVVRGEDLYPSTLAQIYLSSLLQDSSFSNSFFYHHPLVSGQDQLKLSKSAGAGSIRYLRQQGKSRAEVFSTIGREMGLSYPVNDWQSLAKQVVPFEIKIDPGS